MKGVILYKSKYGSTKQFSEWLQEDIGFDIFEISDAPADFAQYNIIVIGSSIHGGMLSLRQWIIHHWESIKDKKVILMLTSGTSNEQFIRKTIEKSLPKHIRTHIKLFPIGGRYLFKSMSFFDRNIIKIVAFFTKHPATKKGMLTERDDVRHDNIQGLIHFITHEQT
ncbi:MAG: flavodoxin domain-containing protein [bacterium]